MLKIVSSSREHSVSPSELKKNANSKREILQLNLNLNSEFIAYIESKKKLKRPSTPDLLQLKEELNDIYISNKLKENIIEELLENIANAKARNDISSWANNEQIKLLNDKQLDTIESINIENFETKKLTCMKLKLEKRLHLLKNQIKEKDVALGKSISQMEELYKSNIFFKNSANLAISTVSNAKRVSSNYKTDFEYKYSQLKTSLGSMKNDSSNLISRLMGISLGNRFKSASKGRLLETLQSHADTAILNQDKINNKAILENYYKNFLEISEITGIDYNQDNIQDFACSIIECLKKSEFKQVSLSMHYFENTQEILTKKKELKELNRTRETINSNLSSERNSESEIEMLDIHNIKKHYSELESTEKASLNTFYHILVLIKNTLIIFNAIEEKTKADDIKLLPSKSALEVILKSFHLFPRKIQENSPNFHNSNLVSNFASLDKNFNLRFFGLHSLVTNDLLEAVTTNYQARSLEFQAKKIIKKCHEIIRKNSKTALKSFTEFLNELKCTNNDSGLTLKALSASNSKSPHKFLARLKSLCDSKPRIGFILSDETASPYLKHEIASLEFLLSSKLPNLEKNMHSRRESESKIVVPTHRSVNESHAIDQKIYSFRAKGRKVSSELIGNKSVQRLPQKFIVKSDIIKRLYNHTRSTSHFQIISCNKKN